LRAIGNRNPACALGRDFVQPNDSGYRPVRNQPAWYPRSGMGSGLSGMRNIVRRFYLRMALGQSASELKTQTIEQPSSGISRACRTNTIEPRAKPIRRAPTSHQRRRAGNDPPAARPAAGAAGSRALVLDHHAHQHNCLVQTLSRPCGNTGCGADFINPLDVLSELSELGNSV
jgi:hypothetical protein